MPRPVRAFACDFKCGKAVVTSRPGMARHEARCFRNPATRSCQTCDNYCPAYRGSNHTDDPSEDHYCGAEVDPQLEPFKTRCESWASERFGHVPANALPEEAVVSSDSDDPPF